MVRGTLPRKRLIITCSTSGIRRVIHAKNLVIGHGQGKTGISQNNILTMYRYLLSFH
jgi:hypothetical protein